VADDGVYVLEEDDPGHYWMGETGFAGFFVMLAEISGGVVELLGMMGLEFDFGEA